MVWGRTDRKRLRTCPIEHAFFENENMTYDLEGMKLFGNS